MATLTCPTILFPLQARKNPEESGVTETPVGLVHVNDDGGSDEAYEMAMDIQYGGADEYFDCNQEIFTDSYIEEDEEELSSYVAQMVDLAYKYEFYPVEDCNFHKLVLQRFKELALANENFELVIVIDKELNKVEN